MNCKKCDTGQMVQKEGKNGLFMACDKYPNCKYTASVPESAKPKDTPEVIARAAIASVSDKAKEYHLSVEEVRARALECAIECMTPSQRMEDNEVLKLARFYEAYLRGG